MKNEFQKWSRLTSFYENENALEENVLVQFRSFLLQNDKPRLKIRVVTISEPPFVTLLGSYTSYCGGVRCLRYEILNNTKVGIPYCCIGYNIDMVKDLERDMHVEAEVYLVEDSFYGAKRNGTWNGIIADLAYGKADIAAAPMAITDERMEDIDFAEVPYIIAGMAILIRINKIESLNFSPLLPLSLGMWLSILALTFFGAILIPQLECLNAMRLPISESVLYFFGLTFQRDIGGTNPRSLSSRVIALSIAISMLIIISTYTAQLTAVTVHHEVKVPVTGFNDDKVNSKSIKNIYITGPDPEGRK